MKDISQTGNGSIVDETLRSLIVLASAVAANWETGVRRAADGLPLTALDDEMTWTAVGIAEDVKARPDRQIKEVADVLTGTNFLENSSPHGCGAAGMARNEAFKRIMLIAAGAAMAAGCEPCLNKVVPELIEVGVQEADIRQAVMIGQQARAGATGSISRIVGCLRSQTALNGPDLVAGCSCG